MNEAWDNKKRAEQHKRTKGATQRKKGKGKPKGKPVPKGPSSIVPVSLYFCECHDEQASKAPCSHTEKDKAENKKSASPLGTWRCSVTKKKCKVRRRKNTDGESVAVV